MFVYEHLYSYSHLSPNIDNNNHNTNNDNYNDNQTDDHPCTVDPLIRRFFSHVFFCFVIRTYSTAEKQDCMIDIVHS